MKPFIVDLNKFKSFFSIENKESHPIFIPGSKKIYIEGISTDTRSLKKRDWFIAIKGDHFNGIDFVDDAIRMGAKGIIVDEGDFNKLKNKKSTLSEMLSTPTIPIIKVPNVIEIYGLLAKFYLNHITQGKNHHRIAITGSAGKTSCKDFLSAMLSEQFEVFTSYQNFNNALGIPHNIFKIEKTYDFYIFELGMNHKGEIDYLTSLIEPHLTVITNILPAHIGFFNSLEKIALAKAEILNHQVDGGLVYMPQNEFFLPLFRKKAKGKSLQLKSVNVDVFSIQSQLEPNSNKCSNIEHRLKTKSNNLKYLNESPVRFSGIHHAINLSLTVQIALDLGLSSENLKKAIALLKTTESRFQIIHNSPLVIDDAYNANPTSMIDAVKWCVELKSEQAFIVLGDVFELGEKEAFYHREIGRKIAVLAENNNKVSFIFLGQAMRVAYEAFLSRESVKNTQVIQVKHFLEKRDALAHLKKTLNLSGLYFFKASNGMRFKELINEFKCFIT